MKTKVAVIVPNWNGLDYIEECLDSLENLTEPRTIIVVDNGSTDGSNELIKQKYTKVVLLEFKDNAGFAGGVNRGIKYAIKNGYKYIALFNDDAVAKKDWLTSLLKPMIDMDDLGIVTGKLMRKDKKHIDSTGDFCSIYGISYPRGRNEKDEGQYDKPEYVFGATGGASLYRVKMLEEIGLFDEDFFAYFEDVDISFRAQLAGWKVYYEPKAVAYHHVGGTSSKLGSFARYHSVKNIILLYNRNMPGMLFWKYKLLFFTQLARMAAGALRDKQFGAYLRGFFKGVFLLPKTWIARKRTMRSKKVSTKYINNILIHNRPPRPPKYRSIS